MSDPRKVMVVGSGAVFTGMNAHVVCADSNNNNTITPNSMQINEDVIIRSSPELIVVNTQRKYNNGQSIAGLGNTQDFTNIVSGREI